MTRKTCYAFLLSCLCAGSLQAAEVEPPAKARLCMACHGPAGNSQRNEVPTIAGISAGVHADAVYEYRDRVRPCGSPLGGDMCVIAESLSDEEIEALGEYFASQLFVPAQQTPEPEKVALGEEIHARECERCHTDGGRDPLDDASILGGQWMGYLEGMLVAYTSGTREAPQKMRPKLDKLSPADIEALVHYYGSLQ